jgi:hypothetical protein
MISTAPSWDDGNGMHGMGWLGSGSNVLYSRWSGIWEIIELYKRHCTLFRVMSTSRRCMRNLKETNEVDGGENILSATT